VKALNLLKLVIVMVSFRSSELSSGFFFKGLSCACLVKALSACKSALDICAQV